MDKTTGIVVGAILLLIVGGVILRVVVFPPTDSATRETSRPGFMKLITVDAKITDVLDAAPSGSDDAAKHYAQAIELFAANKDSIVSAAADLGDGNAKSHADALKTLEDIRGHIGNGAKQASMHYLAKHASGKLQVSKIQDDVERLGQTIDLLDILGDYYLKNKRLKDAEAMYRDMFVAGWHMIEARSHMQMTFYGHAIQISAVNGISKSIERDADKQADFEKRAPLRRYLSVLIEFKSAYEEKALIFHKARLEAGDIWNIAENDEDRAWRVQAILGMGLIKHTHPSKANTARNNAMIEKFLNSSDPMEKMAAQAAKAYSDIDFNMAGTTW